MRSLRNAVLLTLLAASSLAAQAYNYPVLQTPRIVDREYNFVAAAAGDAGTSLLFQWREGLSADWQLLLEGGLASPPSPANTRLLLGGGLAWQWIRATEDFPLDMAVTGEVGFSSGSGFTVERIPVGVSAGHTFKFDNGMELTPFVHPRLSIDHGNGNFPNTIVDVSSTKLDVDIDVGVNYQITQQIAVRVAGLLGGTSYVGATNAIGFSVAWTPKGLKKF
jgi:hypothetical protein